MATDLGLKSWEAKRVRSVIVYFYFGKRRCICSPTGALHGGELVPFEQKLYSVSSHRSCGDFFDEYHHLIKIIVQNKSVTCANPIEKG